MTLSEAQNMKDRVPENPSSWQASKPIDGSQQEAGNAAVAGIDHTEGHEGAEPVEGDCHKKP